MNLQISPDTACIGIPKDHISKVVSCRTTGSSHETIINNNQCEETSIHAADENTIIPFKKNNQRKVYTGKGDCGQCSLLSGDRVMKDAEQVEAYGDIDELNSLLGLLVSVLPQTHCACRMKLSRFKIRFSRSEHWWPPSWILPC